MSSVVTNMFTAIIGTHQHMHTHRRTYTINHWNMASHSSIRNLTSTSGLKPIYWNNRCSFRVRRNIICFVLFFFQSSVSLHFTFKCELQCYNPNLFAMPILLTSNVNVQNILISVKFQLILAYI